jgi:hypothetical protein
VGVPGQGTRTLCESTGRLHDSWNPVHHRDRGRFAQLRGYRSGARRSRSTRRLRAALWRGEIDWRVSVDSTIARVHRHGATATRSNQKPPSHTGGTTE